MVQVRVTRSPDGCLLTLAMTGHVGVTEGPRGANLTCAAVTGLVRSCVQEIVTADGIRADGSAGGEGELHVSVQEVSPAHREWLRGVTDVLVGGLKRMALDAPGELVLLEAPAHGEG